MIRKEVGWLAREVETDVVTSEVEVGGARLLMTSEEVRRKLHGVKPGRIRTHAVRIEGVDHPVKEAFARVTGLDLLDFNTNTARSAFKRLGFEVIRVADSSNS